jgi:predicted CoA-binding protein
MFETRNFMDTRQILMKYKRVAVVGMSANPQRPSHWIARYLQDHGYEVIGVNPGQPNIPGIKVVPSVADLAGPLEIVNVYRSPDAIPGLVDELRSLKPPVLWLQPGAQNSEAEGLARQYGMVVISGNCIYQDHQMFGIGNKQVSG